jgi:hypothetical protein
MGIPYGEHYLPVIGKWIDINVQLNNLNVGTGGTIEAKLTRNGQTITGYLVITLGTGFTIGTTPSFTLPYPLAHTRIANSWTGGIYDASTTEEYVIGGYGISTTEIGFRHYERGATKNITKVSIGATDPIIFATGDIISLSGTYKVADGY